MDFRSCFSRWQNLALSILLLTLFGGFAYQYWKITKPLPEVDTHLQAQFQRIADSLNAVQATRPEKPDQVITPVHINTATKAELQRLPGVGPVLAARILSFRAQRGRIAGAADLLKVKGIGKKTLEKLTGLIIFD